ncbi:MAG: flagellar assembly protein FliW [Hungatella hathewayi]|nr:flagellar assembly protein FliW [Hungatella hathewayi]
MKIETRDFGILEIEEEHVIQFSQPLFGFEEYRRFVLINDSNMGNGICWLQSVEEKQVCFIMLNPLEIKPDYAPAVNDEVLDQLKAEPDDELDCWVLLVIGKTFKQSTANLKSPIIVNHKANLAVQVILDQDYAIRQPVIGEGEVDVC